MNEKFLSYLWKFRLFQGNMTLTNGDSVAILKPGSQNTDSGPDFFNALIKIDDTTWAGNVEIHVKSSDWYLHKHQSDPAYDNIILHVVYENDRNVLRQNSKKIPTLELKNSYDTNIYNKYKSYIASERWIACENDIDKIDYFTLLSWLHRLAVERLEKKSDDITRNLKSVRNNFQEVFYQKLSRYFGFKANNDAFELLAKTMPLKILATHSQNLHQIEALLYGQAGLLLEKYKDEYPKALLNEYRFLSEKYSLQPLEKKIWRFMRMRPANFPTIRISQFAHLIFRSSSLLHRIISEENLKILTGLFKVKASDYWNNHYQFDVKTENKHSKSLGKNSIELLLINTVIPFVFIYGKYHNRTDLTEKAIDWLEQIKGESNNIINHFNQLGIGCENAMQSQAMVHLKENYCNKKRCLECAIGHQLLKTNK